MLNGEPAFILRHNRLFTIQSGLKEPGQVWAGLLFLLYGNLPHLRSPQFFTPLLPPSCPLIRSVDPYLLLTKVVVHVVVFMQVVVAKLKKYSTKVFLDHHS